MKITRRFTKPGADPFASVEYETRTSRITNPDGSIVFEMNDAEIPRAWSQLATDIMVSKYFRKAGVPQTDPPPASLFAAKTETSSPAPKNPPGKSSTASPAAGATGAKSTTTSTPPKTPRRSTMRSFT